MVDNGFFSGSTAKDKRITSTTKNPLSPIGSDDYNKEVDQFIKMTLKMILCIEEILT